MEKSQIICKETRLLFRHNNVMLDVGKGKSVYSPGGYNGNKGP